MKINEDHIRRTISVARRSHFKRFMNGSLFVLDDEIISNGWSHFSHVRLNETSSIHAEIHALGRARHTNLEGATAYLAAISRKSGNVTNSRPCLACAIAMRAAGIEQVVYTTSPSKYAILDLEEDLSNLKIYRLHRVKELIEA